MASMSAAVARGAASALAARDDGAALIVAGTARGVEFGIDAFSWELGPDFEGLAGVPPGLHLVTFAPRSQAAGREAVWVSCAGGSVTARGWDAADECVAHGGGEPPGFDGGPRARAAAAARSGALRLAPYPDGHASVWRGLGARITQATLARVALEVDAVFGPGSADEEGDPSGDGGRAAAADGERAAVWTRCDRGRFARLYADAPPASRPSPTAFYGPDATDRAAALVAAAFGGDWSELAGELELSFVIFLAVGSFGALRQWQRLLALACGCDRAMDGAPGFFADLCALLEAQLALAPPDFFEDPIGRDETALRPSLAALLEAAVARPALAGPARRLFDFSRRRFRLWRGFATLDAALAAGALDADAGAAPVEIAPDAGAAATASEYPAMKPFRSAAEDDLMCATRLLDVGAHDAALRGHPALPAAQRDARAFLEALAAGIGGAPRA